MLQICEDRLTHNKAAEVVLGPVAVEDGILIAATCTPNGDKSFKTCRRTIL
jgi:hypothetical protein